MIHTLSSNYVDHIMLSTTLYKEEDIVLQRKFRHHIHSMDIMCFPYWLGIPSSHVSEQRTGGRQLEGRKQSEKTY